MGSPLEPVYAPPFTEEQLRNPGTSRTGAVVPYTFVEGPDVWYSADQLARQDEWLHVLTDEQVAELEAAVEGALQSGVAQLDDTGKYLSVSHEATHEDFPLPTLGVLLLDVIEDVKRGRGFALLRGVPVHRWTRVQSLVAYWGIGLYWGKTQPQNQKSHLIGHVKEVGIDPDNAKGTTRVYMTRREQPWHVDTSDLVSLLFLKTAKSGGHSGWASSATVYNEILRTRPDLVPVLAGTWYLDRKKEVPPGKKPYFIQPIINWHDGHLSIQYADGYYQLPPKLYPGEVPPLTPQQEEAIRVFNEIADRPDIHIQMALQPGDLQIIQNFTILHNRSQYEDHEHPDDKRHLLRMWLSPEDGRPLPEHFAELWGNIEPGKRGGVGYKFDPKDGVFPLEAEVGQLKV
ncbi:hypothetical protein MNEG_4075 [Monoraphidium neglectum]|uniref:TauD/TfdA-like domain-containing protein n=1 Tax=Monoraphidium neglectum TaxID=145388 RepID=A0A0D2LAR1_9CHLO|nr:hypothetical protein MNEG_4075 [Monoraphidium neglectum]KIZ03879.1 hypothetical protein MNEG_4075 [Monoraphidium neglectum]|eukprot:XP_013902898.1 hypothetical protein MNEG_4075 [Monoraphidium neglectum]